MADSHDTRAAGRAWTPAGSGRFRPVLAACGAVLLATAGVFAAYVAAHPGPLPMTADRGWLSVLRQIRDPFLTRTAEVLSLIAGPAGGTVIVAIVAVFLWFVRKRRIGAVFLAATLALTSGASQLIKHLVLRPRPPGQLVPADAGSFPSGHVITALAVGTVMSCVLARPGHRRLPMACAVTVTLIMVWARTYLGEHWLSDTVESVLVAGGMVLTGWAFAGWFADREAAAGDAGTRDSPALGGVPEDSDGSAGLSAGRS